MKPETDQTSTTLLPLLLSAGDVAKLLGISTRSVWNMLADGKLGPLPVRLGGRTLWRTTELQAWTEADCPPRDRWLDMKKRLKKI